MAVNLKNGVDPYKKQRSAASYLGLHSVSISF